jgi:hypothetical protein
MQEVTLNEESEGHTAASLLPLTEAFAAPKAGIFPNFRRDACNWRRDNNLKLLPRGAGEAPGEGREK